MLRSCTPPDCQLAFRRTVDAAILVLNTGALTHGESQFRSLPGEVHSQRLNTLAGVTRPVGPHYWP
jgi:hypothetical protein